jgi:hydrogenase maturation protein HypF
MAEHGLREPVLGVTFDGTGYGTDGAIWGGEFLVGDYVQYRRAVQLRYVRMPGGDQASREPWRMALAHLLDAGLDGGLLKPRVPAKSLQIVARMLEREFNAPRTSSAGRLFDAVACLAGLRDQVSYEGQAAVELEWLATDVAADGHYPFDLSWTPAESPSAAARVVDTRPLIRAVSEDVVKKVSPAVIARRFHATMVEIIVAVCDRLRQETGLVPVVLSGGVFLNALLTAEVGARLREAGFRVYRHRLVPPSDGGLSLGQLAVAAGQAC